MKKEREGRALSLFFKWQTSIGEEGRLEITKLQKEDISLIFPELIDVHLTLLRGSPASILLNTLPQSQVPKEPFASLPSA